MLEDGRELAHADAGRLGGADEGITLQKTVNTCRNRKTIFLHDGGDVAVTLDDRGPATTS